MGLFAIWFTAPRQDLAARETEFAAIAQSFRLTDALGPSRREAHDAVPDALHERPDLEVLLPSELGGHDFEVTSATYSRLSEDDPELAQDLAKLLGSRAGKVLFWSPSTVVRWSNWTGQAQAIATSPSRGTMSKYFAAADDLVAGQFDSGAAERHHELRSVGAVLS